MGTSLQNVYDWFFLKVPDENFSGKEEIVFALLQIAIGYSYKTVPESLDFVLDESNEGDEMSFDGNFVESLGYDTVQLLSLVMAKEFYRRTVSKLASLKQHVGTQAFNKLPDSVKQLNEARTRLSDLESEIYSFRQEFYKYPH